MAILGAFAVLLGGGFAASSPAYADDPTGQPDPSLVSAGTADVEVPPVDDRITDPSTAQNDGDDGLTPVVLEDAVSAADGVVPPQEAPLAAEAPATGLMFATSVNVASAAVGDEISYAIVVSNAGGAAVDDLVVVDELPDGVEFVSATSGGEHADGIVGWKLGQLPGGTDRVLEVVVRVLDQAADTTVVNRANVNGTGIQGVPNDTECADDPGWACAATTIAPAAQGLMFAKTANLASASTGDEISYAIVVSNAGGAAVDDLVVVDELPDGVEFVSATSGGEHADGIVGWKLGQLPGDTDRVLEVVVRVLDQAADTTVVNRANVKGDGIQGVPNDTECADDPGWACAATAIAPLDPPVQPGTELVFTKKADLQAASVGDEITYTLTARNEGGVDLTQVVLEDALPEHVEFVSASDGGAQADGVVRWPETSLAAGASLSRTVVVKVLPDAAGSTVTNCATVDCTTSPVRNENTVPVWFCEDYPDICAAAVPVPPGVVIDGADDPIPGLPPWFSTNFFFLYPGPQGDGLPDDLNALPADIQAIFYDVAGKKGEGVDENVTPLHSSDCATTVIDAVDEPTPPVDEEKPVTDDGDVPDSELPVTGSSAVVPAVMAALLLGAGTLLVARSRRMRTRLEG